MCVLRKVGKVHPAWQVPLVVLLVPIFLDFLLPILQLVSLLLIWLDSHPLVEVLFALAVGILFYFISQRAKRQRPTQNDPDIDNELDRLRRENKKE